MMLRPNVLKVSAVAFLATLVAITSCNEEEVKREPLSLQDTADLMDEALTDAYFQDLDDMAGKAIEAPSDAEYNAGRTKGSITIEDHRFKCGGITVTIEPDETSEPANPKGVLTIDFGTTGCEDLKGNVRKGKLIFTYDGKRFMPGSTVVATTENYFINGVQLEGTRTLTNVQNSSEDAPRFTAVLANGKATFPNALTATRESEITWQWNRAANPLDDNLQVEASSTAAGTTRLGRAYEVKVVEPLVYKRHCGIAVSGVKKYIIQGNKEIIINYGDGECDRSFSITVNGTTHEITL